MVYLVGLLSLFNVMGRDQDGGLAGAGFLQKEIPDAETKSNCCTARKKAMKIDRTFLVNNLP